MKKGKKFLTLISILLISSVAFGQNSEVHRVNALYSNILVLSAQYMNSSSTGAHSAKAYNGLKAELSYNHDFIGFYDVSKIPLDFVLGIGYQGTGIFGQDTICYQRLNHFGYAKVGLGTRIGSNASSYTDNRAIAYLSINCKAGYGTYNYAKYVQSGMIVGAGADLQVRITPHMSVIGSVDYLVPLSQKIPDGYQWKENKETFLNFSIGLTFDFGN